MNADGSLAFILWEDVDGEKEQIPFVYILKSGLEEIKVVSVFSKSSQKEKETQFYNCWVDSVD